MFVKIAEKVFVIFSLLFLSDAILPPLSGQGVAWARSIASILSYVILVGIILLNIMWHKKVARLFIKEKLLFVLVGIVIVSVVWSAAPGATVRNAIVLVRGTLLGMYLAARYSLNEQLRLLALLLGISALLCVVFALALPTYGVMGMGPVIDPQEIAHAGTWRGIYIHKNPLGRIMTLSAVIFFILTKSNHGHRWVAWSGFFLSVLLILKSTSKTSLLMLVFLIALLPIYRALRWSYSLAVPFFMSLILVGGSLSIVLVGNAEEILGAFGRDASFSGRVPLWTSVLDKIWERPWLGYGYSGFWQGLQGESGDILRGLNWIPPHSHNGFLEIWLALGLLGLSVFFLSFITACFRAITWVRQSRAEESLWLPAYLTFLFFANLTENSLMNNNFLWILYVAVTLSMHNRSDNLVESNLFWQQKVNKKVIKQMKQPTQGSGA